MAIPGLLVEYLISGAIALIWLYPLLRNAGFAKTDPSYLPFLVLGLYVVGMMIDFSAWALTRPIKHRIRRWTENRYGIETTLEKGKGVARHVKFALYAPEVAKEVSMRSSRDRIARGAIINSILATIFVLPLLAGIPLILFTSLLWAGFERVSYSYELKAEQAVDEKNRLNTPKAAPNNSFNPTPR
jgi:hypothetical protein